MKHTFVFLVAALALAGCAQRQPPPAPVAAAPRCEPTSFVVYATCRVAAVNQAEARAGPAYQDVTSNWRNQINMLISLVAAGQLPEPTAYVLEAQLSQAASNGIYSRTGALNAADQAEANRYFWSSTAAGIGAYGRAIAAPQPQQSITCIRTGNFVNCN